MSQTFDCEKCKKSYKTKASLTRHTYANKCVAAKVEDSNDQTGAIIRLVDALHDMMRADAIIGVYAYHDINKLLFIRFIQPYLDNKLNNLLDARIYLSADEDFDISLLEYLKDLNKLCDQDIESFDGETKAIYKKVLAVHPMTKELFKVTDYFKASPKIIRESIRKIMKDLTEFNFDELSQDIKGLLYEHFLNGYAGKGGKEFGQFFTPRNLISLVIKLNNEAFADFGERKIGTIHDPCMGTAGFLTEAYKYIKSKGIEPELYGSELESKTYTSGIMNVLLTTGEIHNLKCQNSFYANEPARYDWIVSNPPFGLKGIKRADIVEKCDSLRENEEKRLQGKTMYPVDINDASALFLMHCMAKLKKNGICNIVLPDGKLTNSGGKYMQLRRLLVEKYNLTAVLSVPGGTFTHAGVSTVVLFFSREVDQTTEEVKFYTAINECSAYNHIASSSYDQMTENNYSLNYKTYIQTKRSIAKIDCKMMKLGEICDISIGFTPLTSNKDFYGDSGHIWVNISDMKDFYIRDSSKKITDLAIEGKHKKLVKEGSVLFSFKLAIGKAAIAETELYTNEAIASINVKDADVASNLYIAYYLKCVYKTTTERGCIGNGNLNTELLKDIDICIPSLDVQREIVNKCEEIQKIKSRLKQSIDDALHMIKIYTDICFAPNSKTAEVKTFRDICVLKPGKHSSSKTETEEKGDVRFITKHIDNRRYMKSNNYDYDGKYSYIYKAYNGNGVCNIQYYEGKAAVSNLIYAIECEDIIVPKYFYYYVLTQKIKYIQEKCQKGAANKSLDVEEYNKITISIPAIESQRNIVMELDDMMSSIDKLKKKISICDEMINSIIKSYLH